MARIAGVHEQATRIAIQILVAFVLRFGLIGDELGDQVEVFFLLLNLLFLLLNLLLRHCLRSLSPFRSLSIFLARGSCD